MEKRRGKGKREKRRGKGKKGGKNSKEGEKMEEKG